MSVNRSHRWTFIQLPPAAELPSLDVDYRAGFQQWASKWGNPNRDRAIIYTLDPEESESLAAQWAVWAHVDVRVAVPMFAPAVKDSQRVFRASTAHGSVHGTDSFAVHRFAPSQEVVETDLPAQDLQGLMSTPHSANSRIALCADLRDARQREFLALLASCSAVCLVTADTPSSLTPAIQQELEARGFRPAGRPFGQAKTSVAYIRPANPLERARAFVARNRVNAGLLLERLKRTPNKSRPVSPSEASRTSTRNSFLGDDIGVNHLPVSRSEIATIIESVRKHTGGAWFISTDREWNPDDVARACHQELGVWPISFSYPTSLSLSPPSNPISPIIPGVPYAFTSNDEYLKTYSQSSMALTFRKAGWDCFRHVEILASGAVPLMPDAEFIPKYSMIHYPKRAMADVARAVMSRGGVPDAKTHEAFRNHFTSHLTSEAMARYMLAMSGHLETQRVLFIDQNTPTNPEYQSTLALIGLKQLLGARCEVAFPAAFLYRDSHESTLGFYGRGFGYTHMLNPDYRSTSERENRPGYGVDALRSFDTVVIGSSSRNSALTRTVLDTCDPANVILIHGEDGPPPEQEARFLRDSGAAVFVRAIHV